MIQKLLNLFKKRKLVNMSKFRDTEHPKTLLKIIWWYKFILILFVIMSLSGCGSSTDPKLVEYQNLQTQRAELESSLLSKNIDINNRRQELNTLKSKYELEKKILTEWSGDIIWLQKMENEANGISTDLDNVYTNISNNIYNTSWLKLEPTPQKEVKADLKNGSNILNTGSQNKLNTGLVLKTQIPQK